jgi:DNA-directed RNA polymerase specialized sigma24 family protein
LDDLRQANLPSCAQAPASVLPIGDFWQQLLPGSSGESGADQWAAYRHPTLKQRIRFAVESLAPGDMELLTMAHGERFAVFEMAAILRTTPSVVRARYRRALEQFQEMFQLTESPRPTRNALVHA